MSALCIVSSLSAFVNRKTAGVMALIMMILSAAWGTEHVALIKISGAIGPITASYIERAIKQSETRKDACLIIQLDTPGGLLNSTKEIVQLFFSSPVPTVVYIAPAGATATSAGCFITLAADVAVMALGTSIGAAHPVSIGGGEAQKTDEVMKKKLENYASTFIETIAAKRKRNVGWAKSSVVESAAITAEKALEIKVVDFLAKDVTDLLAQLEGRTINGKTFGPSIKVAEVREIAMLVREKVFQRLWSPEVMYILMLIAIYGIIGELSNPGAIFPAVAGGIALILALFMGSVLPVNAAGVALIVLAVILFITDIFALTHGVLTGGGIISFLIGSLMLFDTAGSVFRLSLALVIPATIISAAFFIYVFGAGLRAQFLPVKTGKEDLIGRTAVAITPVNAESGRVFVEGEYWNAVSEEPVAGTQRVIIEAVQGLTLKVKQLTKG
jgi:membrane-bound serine protease (ClpP class)